MPQGEHTILKPCLQRFAKETESDIWSIDMIIWSMYNGLMVKPMIALTAHAIITSNVTGKRKPGAPSAQSGHSAAFWQCLVWPCPPFTDKKCITVNYFHFFRFAYRLLHTGGGRICPPLLVFQNNSKTVADIDTKFGVPYPTSIWHRITKFWRNRPDFFFRKWRFCGVISCQFWPKSAQC